MAGIHEERIVSIPSAYPPLAEAIDTLLNTGLASINIYQFAETYGEKYFNDIVSCVKKDLAGFIGTSRVAFSTLQMSIELQEMREVFLQHILDTTFHASIGLNKLKGDGAYEKPTFRIRKQKGQEKLDIYITFENQTESQLPRNIIEERIIWYIFRTLHHALFSDVIIQLTERTLLSVLPLPLKRTKLTEEILTYITNQSEESHNGTLPRPVSQYLSFTIDVPEIGSAEMASRKQQIEKNAQIQTYLDLADLLETHILDGSVGFSTPEPGPSREILFYPTQCTSPLELAAASSMVKELTPLVFHLRYFAQPNELLVIDEPEMNLHPKAQVQMLELLAMLVNAGINVLVTTHSPYMIDHLGNITKAYQHSEKERIQQEFYLQDSRAFIAENNVSMYFIGKGTIQDTLHDEELDWDTFGDVSDRLNEIYFSL